MDDKNLHRRNFLSSAAIVVGAAGLKELSFYNELLEEISNIKQESIDIDVDKYRSIEVADNRLKAYGVPEGKLIADKSCGEAKCDGGCDYISGEGAKCFISKK